MMKSRTWKKTGIVTVIPALVVIVFGMAAPRFLDLNRYHGFIVTEVQKASGGQVTLGRISWGFTHRLWLEVDGFSIANPSAFTGDVKLTRLYASISLPRLLTRKVLVKKLQLESPGIKYRLEPGTQGTDAAAGNTITAGVQLPVEVEIERLAIEVDRLELSDSLTLPGETLLHVFTDVELTATSVAPETVMAFNVSLQDKAPSGLGSLKAQGTFSGLTRALTLENPQLKLQAALKALSAEVIKPYFKDSQLNDQLSGSVSLQVDYQGDLGENLHAQGSIDLGQLRYANPELWEVPLAGADTTLGFQISLDPQNLSAEKITLTRGTLSLDAQGVVHGWNQQPVISNAEFSSNLPLADLPPLIPWKQLGEDADLIRPILEGGGTLVINKLAIAGISLEKLPATLTDWLPEIEMVADVTGVILPAIQNSPKIQNIEGSVQLANGIAQVQVLKARLASIDLPPVSAEITSLMKQPKIHATINGELKLDINTDVQLQTLLKEIGLGKLIGVARLEEVIGVANLDLTVDLETARPEDYQLQGTAGMKDFLLKTAYSPALFHDINISLDIKPAVATVSEASAIVTMPTAATSAGNHFTLDIQARADEWRSNPVFTLQHLETSRIALSLLASILPWEELGQSAQPVKAILQSGGFMTISDLSLPAIDLAKRSKEPQQLLAGAALAADLTDITVPRGLLPVIIEGINGQVSLEKDVLLAENVQARVGPVALPVLNIRATGVADHFKLALRGKGPLQLATAGDRKIEQLLLEHGLKDLDVSADIDVSADFDQHNPEDWTASGTLLLKDVSATTDPAAVVMEHLTGQVTFRREKTMQITAQNISTRINQAPLQLSGTISGIGSPDLLVNGRAMSKGLDLAQLAELVPALKNINVQGVLDMDVDVHVPYSAPAGSRLKGMVSAQNAGFQLASPALAIARGDMDLALSGNTATIKNMSMTVNEQQLAVSGRLSNPVEPDIKLMLTAPDLDIDRLLPADTAAKPVSTASNDEQYQGENKPATASKTRQAELPPLARKLSADVQLQADRAQYKGMHFEKLNLELLYQQGLLKSFDLNAGMDNGQFTTSGSADLRDLQHISFTLDPDISALPLAEIAPALGVDRLPLTGPLTVTGQLRGTTGSSGALLAGLAGKLDVSLGPGNLNKVGKIGDFFAKLFSIDKIGALFSGRLFRDFSSRGIYFENITAQPAFDQGMLNIGNLHFGSDVMTVDARGTLDMIDEKLKIQALLVPLATVDDALSYVPLVGHALEDVSKVRIDVEGPLDDPEIHTAEAREIGKGIETEVEQPETILEGAGKGLEKVF